VGGVGHKGEQEDEKLNQKAPKNEPHPGYSNSILK
jgi:hypothetical protein